MTMVCMSTGCVSKSSKVVTVVACPSRMARETMPTGVPGSLWPQQQVPHRAQLPVPFLALGVIEHDDKIALGRQLQALFNRLPGGEEVAQGDDDKIVHQGRAQERRAGGQGRDAGDHLQVKVHVRTALGRPDLEALGGAHLQDQPGHAVDAGVTAGDQGHLLPGPGPVQGQLAALHFGLHAGGHHFLGGQQGTHQVDIGLVAHHHLGLGQGLS